MYRHTRNLGPRAEYREQQGIRVTASPSLAAKYTKLKSLTVQVGYFAPDGIVQYRQMTHTVNLDHAKVVYRMNCCSDECVQGDHEITEELAKAIAKQSTTVSGELCCDGWQNKDLIRKAKCNHVLRYTLKLGY